MQKTKTAIVTGASGGQSAKPSFKRFAIEGTTLLPLPSHLCTTSSRRRQISRSSKGISEMKPRPRK